MPAHLGPSYLALVDPSPTDAEQGLVWPQMDIQSWASHFGEPGQSPIHGASDAAGGQVPCEGQHGAMEGAPGPSRPDLWAFHHVSWGLKGLE
jgi:hypothetical protein